MQKIFLIFASLLSGVCLFAQSKHDNILGKWTNDNKTRVIEFVKNGDEYEAIIRSAEDDSLVGKKQITGLKAADQALFVDGTAHVIRKGKTLKCSAALSDDSRLHLEARHGRLSKKQIWTKL